MIFLYFVLNIWYQSSRSWGFVVASETPQNFRYNFFSTTFSEETPWRIFIRWIKLRGVQSSSSIDLYIQRYIQCNIGFQSHPDFIHRKIFSKKNFYNVQNPETQRIFTEIIKVVVIKISASGSSYFCRYTLCKIGYLTSHINQSQTGALGKTMIYYSVSIQIK